MTTLAKRFEVQMRNAFWDLLEEKVASDPPDYDWIVRLYTEIRDRLCSFVSQGSNVRKEISAGFDVVLFSQMIRNDAFDGDDMTRLIGTTFCFISSLQAPCRDAELQRRRQEITDHASSGGTFATIVPMYIKSSHFMMDLIQADIEALSKQKGS